MSQRDLEGKLSLVTGGASGIGRAVCQLFAAHGAKVIIADIQKDAADSVLDSLSKCSMPSEKSEHLAVCTDVSKSTSVDDLWEAINCRFGEPPSVVVHCAGIVKNLTGLENCSESIFDQVINVNVKGTYLVNRKFALLMKSHNIKGSIVNVSSVAVRGVRFAPEYAASKAAQVGWTWSLAKELAPFGIRCNTVHPGAIDTPFVKDFPAEQVSNPAVRPNIPLGRLGTAEEVAQVCLFLASDRSSYVTQSCYDVHGGCTENP